jgi:hypothetical protein
VEHGDVVILAGRGMPAEQMIVVRANLSGPVVVPDVVIIDLGERNAQQARHEDRNPQHACHHISRRPTENHARTSAKKSFCPELRLRYYGFPPAEGQAAARGPNRRRILH